MPRFHYTAVDSQGLPLSGDVDGASLAAVRDALLKQGFEVRELFREGTAEGQLTSLEAAAITHQISSATNSELPLVGSLRAFSEEVFSYRLKQRLIRVCDALEAGEPLGAILADPDLRLPPSVGAILGSGLPHRAMNQLLSQSVRAVATTAELRSRTVLMFLYPTLMLLVMFAFWIFLLTIVTPQFGKIFEDFGTEIPVLTQHLIGLSGLFSGGSWLTVLVLIPILGLLFVGFCFVLPPATRQRIWCGTPIIGSMYRLTSLSEFARLLAAMLECGIPLPQALTWSTLGVNDADLRERAAVVSARLQNGEDPVTLSQQMPDLPAHMEQMLRFAARGPDGSDPLRSQAQLLETQAKSLSQIALPLMEPIMLLAAVMSISVYVLAMFLPLIKLLNDLS